MLVKGIRDDRKSKPVRHGYDPNRDDKFCGTFRIPTPQCHQDGTNNQKGKQSIALHDFHGDVVPKAFLFKGCLKFARTTTHEQKNDFAFFNSLGEWAASFMYHG